MVFENRFPSLQRVPGVPDAVVTDAPLQQHAPAAGRCEVVCFSSDHRASFGALRRSGSARSSTRGRTAPPRWAPSRGGAGLLLREPRPGDRRHPAPPARPDLRLPVRDAAHARAARPGPRAPPPHRPQPAARRPRVRARGRPPRRPRDRALGRVRALRGAVARRGPPRAAARRPRPARAHGRRARRPRQRVPRAAAPPGPVLRDGRRRPHPLPYIAAWHQAPAREGRSVADGGTDDVTLARLHSRCSPCCARPASSSTSRARSRAWARGSATPRPSASPHGSRSSPRRAPPGAGCPRCRTTTAPLAPAPSSPRPSARTNPARRSTCGPHPGASTSSGSTPTTTRACACRSRCPTAPTWRCARAPTRSSASRPPRRPARRGRRASDVRSGEVAGWGSYVAGVAWALREHLVAQGADPAAVPGFDAAVDSEASRSVPGSRRPQPSSARSPSRSTTSPGSASRRPTRAAPPWPR